MLASSHTLQNVRVGRDLQNPVIRPCLLTAEEIETQRGRLLSTDTNPVHSRARIRPQVFSLRLVHFVSLLSDGPKWFIFCLDSPVLSSAGPSLLQVMPSGSFPCLSLPADVSLLWPVVTNI